MSSSRQFGMAVIVALAAGCCPAATLQQLSLDELSGKSTAVVRAQVVSSSANLTGTTIYTHYKLQITETLKGSPRPEVMVPGGTVGKYTQTFPGVPYLESGKEYLLFLWTSSAGITHLTGLSQGVFALSKDATGAMQASRGSIGELMLDKTGRQVRDKGMQMSVTTIRGKLSAQRAKGPVQ